MQKQTKKLIGVIPDIHFRENLAYSEYVDGGRQQEEKDVLDFIVSSFSDCNSIIFVGDLFNSRTNPPSVIKKLVNFLERFDDKILYIISGNHDSSADGKTALDFLKEVKGKKWNIITNDIVSLGGFTMCPYFFKAQLEAKDNKEATAKIMKKLKDNPGKILFVHFAISNAGMMTELFNEIVLPKNELEKIFDLVVGGHIHKVYESGKTLIVGSLIPQEVGEHEKFIFKIDEDTLKVKKIKLPTRGIYKLTDPTDKDLEIPKNSIVKVVITEKMTHAEIEALKEKLKVFDAHILIIDVKNERKRVVGGDIGLLSAPVEQLLEIYGKERGVDVGKLNFAFQLIK
jgi:DNA repair exonuclease SbcCD nuclease subunit